MVQVLGCGLGLVGCGVICFVGGVRLGGVPKVDLAAIPFIGEEANLLELDVLPQDYPAENELTLLDQLIPKDAPLQELEPEDIDNFIKRRKDSFEIMNDSKEKGKGAQEKTGTKSGTKTGTKTQNKTNKDGREGRRGNQVLAGEQNPLA